MKTGTGFFTIGIESLKLPVHLGCDDAERGFRQFVTMDLTLTVEDRGSTVSDELEDTVDYRSIVGCVERMCAERSWKLIEKMCRDVGGKILAAFPMVRDVRVTVHKNVVVSAAACSVTLEMVREG